MSQSIVSVNGTSYDKVTGLPVGKEEQSITKPKKSRVVLGKPSKSQKIINRPTTKEREQPSQKRSPMVSRYTPKTPPAQPGNTTRLISDISPVSKPKPRPIKKVPVRSSPTPAPTPAAPAKKSSSETKNEMIKEALDKAPLHKNNSQVKTPRRMPRLVGIATLAVILLGAVGYFTYTNLPHVSVYVASVRSGVNAKYPSYQPDGYRLSSVNYDDSSVNMKFKSNGGPLDYAISQKHTSWDSTAVQDNYAKEKWGNDTETLEVRGLTIFYHDGSAAWVNGGILYEISGSARLASSQVRNIATSF